MNVDEFLANISTDEKAFNLAKSLGLITSNVRFCSRCGGKMNLEKWKTRHGIDVRLRCIKRYCRKTASIFENSIFEYGHLKMRTVFMLFYCYSEKKTRYETSSICEIDMSTVTTYFSYFREAILKYSYFVFVSRGEAPDESEVDETHLYSFKNHQ